MKITITLSLLATTALLAVEPSGTTPPSGPEHSSAPVAIPILEVVDQEMSQSSAQNGEQIIGTTTTVSKETIEVQGGAAQISPYKAIATQPGVDIRSKDAFGMEITHRIRGKSNRNIGETLEGLPLKGIGPGNGLSTIIDQENIAAIALSKGAISADSGFGYGSDNGMVDMLIRRPAKQFHTQAKQVLGTDNFTRSYLRVDSGKVGEAARAFVSASYTNADKWKGEGQSPGGRKNAAFGLCGTSGQKIGWELYGFYNNDRKHSYRGLSYEQTRDLSTNRDFDYNTELTGDPKEDAYYYDYNRQQFETYAFLGKLELPLSDRSLLTLRPYYLHDEGRSFSGSGGKVIDWLVDHDTYGAVAEYRYAFESGAFKAGYWYQQDEPPGPPTSRKLRSTDGLAFLGWERLVGVEKNHTFSAPFATLEKRFGNTIVKGGVKYLWMSSPELVSYNTAGLPDVGYETALSMSHTVDFTLRSKTHELFLPNLGIVHLLSENTLLKASYGKNYNTPNYSFGGGVIKLFKKGITEAQLQQMWDDLRPETSDNIDLGITYEDARNTLTGTLFYSLVEHVGGTFYDPDLAMSYQQNTAEARAYGLEIAAGRTFSPHLDAQLSATYNRYEFTSDLQTIAGSAIASKGHQLPDVPEWMANLSATWREHGFSVTPTLKYLGKRYADVENRHSVDPHFLVDLAFRETIPLGQGERLRLSASVTNLLDEEYIAVISAADTSVGLDAPTYYVGAPRSFFVSLQYDF